MTLEHKDRDTQARLLESACNVFADKGYRDATIAEICDGAEANIAAVNYYFRNKDTLYVEAWRRAFNQSIATHPPDGGVPADAPAERRLLGRITSILERIADPACREFDLVRKEMAHPTGLLSEVMRECIEPIHASLAALVRELLGDRASQTQVELCVGSVRSQCFNAMMHERLRKKDANFKPPGPVLDIPVEAFANHILRFSLAGIREVRSRIESGELADPE